MSDPKPYDLNKKDDIERLIRELKSYMTVSLKDGTDSEGRQYALDALTEIVNGGYEVSLDTEPFEPPTVGNEVI